MAERLGMPYLGSKNAIARWVIDQLPEAETFVDLFCGGCSVTHAAIISGKYNKFIINDLRPGLSQMFVDAINGKYTLDNHKEFISREEFHKRKDTDLYVSLIWSFGNNGKDYLYGRQIEDIKHAFHDACFFNDISRLESLGIKLSNSECVDIYSRYLDYKKRLKIFLDNHDDYQEYKKALKMSQSITDLERLQSLSALDRLQSLSRLRGVEHLERLKRIDGLKNIDISSCINPINISYEDFTVPENAVIYCDIPYRNTECHSYEGFDHEKFYAWAYDQDNIFISEYWMPEGFIEIASVEKYVCTQGKGNALRKTEKIFTNRRTYDRLPEDIKKRVGYNGTAGTPFDMGFNPYQE